jgi:hypothetical protein
MARGKRPAPGAHTYHHKGSPEGSKVHKVMHEFKHHELHSGSKHGPKVTNRKQAIAIALSEQRKKNRGGYK